MERNHRFLFAIAVVALATMACSALSGLGIGDNALLRDDFSDETWGTGTDADSSVEYVNNALNFSVFKDFYFVWSTPNDTNYENVHIEVTAINNSSDSTGAFGIICHMQVTDVSHYLVITGAGEYAIGRSSLTAEDFFLTNGDRWGSSDLIPVNADSYRLGADCGNGRLTLYVNGQQIDSVTDSTYTSGYLALMAWSGEEVFGTDVSFDDFVVTPLE